MNGTKISKRTYVKIIVTIIANRLENKIQKQSVHIYNLGSDRLIKAFSTLKHTSNDKHYN